VNLIFPFLYRSRKSSLRILSLSIDYSEMVVGLQFPHDSYTWWFSRPQLRVGWIEFMFSANSPLRAAASDDA